MSLKIGIVGLPNVGKSTLFHALTKKQVDCANYPFCTIDPNVGVVEVPDERLAVLAAISKSEKIVPASVEFVDIAGLVRGASTGEGLGNKFLSHIREVDALVHVVRVFTDVNVVHVDNRVDPCADIATIDIELALADLAVIEKLHERAEREAKAGVTREREIELGLLARLKNALAGNTPARALEYTEDETIVLKRFQLLTAKPVLYVANVAETEVMVRPNLGVPIDEMIALSVRLESELADLPKNEAREYLAAAGLSMTGLDRLIVASYKLLGLITFLTTGEKETRAWTIRRGVKAPEAAGVIHTDFQKAFIRAEIIDYADYVACGSEARARETGKLRIEGKDYIMREDDVVHFRVGV